MSQGHAVKDNSVSIEHSALKKGISLFSKFDPHKTPMGWVVVLSKNNPRLFIVLISLYFRVFISHVNFNLLLLKAAATF